jgi:hypothetical protein
VRDTRVAPMTGARRARSRTASSPSPVFPATTLAFA